MPYLLEEIMPFSGTLNNSAYILVVQWTSGEPSIGRVSIAELVHNASSGSVVSAGGSASFSGNDTVLVIRKSVGSATVVTLPAAPSSWTRYVVKDGKGDAAVNNITVTASNGNIDGAASFVISQNYASFGFVYDGTNWNVV